MYMYMSYTSSKKTQNIDFETHVCIYIYIFKNEHIHIKPTPWFGLMKYGVSLLKKCMYDNIYIYMGVS